MKGVTKAARKANELSRMCENCSHVRNGNPHVCRICSDAFVEGFKKGSKAAEKRIKQSK